MMKYALIHHKYYELKFESAKTEQCIYLEIMQLITEKTTRTCEITKPNALQNMQQIYTDQI